MRLGSGQGAGRRRCAPLALSQVSLLLLTTAAPVCATADSGGANVGSGYDIENVRRALTALRSVDGLDGLDGLCLRTRTETSASPAEGDGDKLSSLFPRCGEERIEDEEVGRTSAGRRVRRLGSPPSASTEAVEVAAPMDSGANGDVVGTVDVAAIDGSTTTKPLGADPSAAAAMAEEAGGEGEGGPHPESYYIFNGLMAFACVCLAALAAGLTLGVLSLDPLMLLIKVRAGETEKERRQAASLLPVVGQHHLLLVTLLLMNSIANEALPLFLDKIFGPLGAVIVSVTLVLFFGEIIPSAVFTGPNQLAIAASLVPLLKLIMALLCPLSWPIAKMLDCILHDEDDDVAAHGMSIYNRSEMAALVRIQYEERLATKKRRKAEMRKLQSLSVREGEGSTRSASARSGADGGADWSERASNSIRSASLRSFDIDHATKTYVREVSHREKLQGMLDEARQVSFQDEGAVKKSGEVGAASPPPPTAEVEIRPATSIDFATPSVGSILHRDEVAMVEGALRMTEITAVDAYKPLRSVYSVPYDMVLNEKNVVDIFSQGYSRVPVYARGAEGPSGAQRDGGASADDDGEGNDDDDRKSICGVLIAKNLIVVDPSDERGLSTLPLQQPLCVPPNINLVDLLNLMQTGGKGNKGGHMAVVCARPTCGNQALDAGMPIPADAGVMGIITLEDIIEELLQEEIYDENDRIELEALRRAQWAVGRWKTFIKRKRVARARLEASLAEEDVGGGDNLPPIGTFVRAAVRFLAGGGGSAEANGEISSSPAAEGRGTETSERKPEVEAEEGELEPQPEEAAEGGESKPLLDKSAEEGEAEYQYGTHNIPELN